MGKTLQPIHRMFRATDVGWAACEHGGDHEGEIGRAQRSEEKHAGLERLRISDRGRAVFLRTPMGNIIGE
jgi:hypothetical protein